MKKLLSLIVVATLVLSSVVYAADTVNVSPTRVDVVAAATGTAPAPTTGQKPAANTATTLKEITRILAENSFGNDVKLVQAKLNENGYKLVVDGIFGKLTVSAVKDYQSKNGLKADGMVGPKTLAKLSPVVAATPAPVTPAPETPAPPVDTVASASLVSDEAAFEKAIAKDGTWIIATLKDLTFDKELVLTGNFKNGKQDKVTGLDSIQRKIALYTQDDKRNVTGRFTLKAPKLTILSPKASLEKGTFVGDLYVSVPGFRLVDQVVEGNIYFTTKEAKDTFAPDATSKITGKQELIAVDAVTTASLVNDAAAFEKAIAKDGTWIISVLNDLTFDKELVLTGNFKNGKQDKVTLLDSVQRKVALYTQDEKRFTTGRFTLKAPKLTILSPKASLEKGTFIGDIYVSVPGFRLVDAVVDGNIYFTTKEAKDTFAPDATSIVTGKQELIAVDAVTTASLVNDAAAFEKAIAKDGTWIISVLNDLTFDKELVLTGNFKNGKTDAVTGLASIQRKIALYTQDEKRFTTGRFTLKAPKLTILSPKASLEKGTFIGDIYVSVPGFALKDAVVDGNIYFTTKEAKDTFAPDATSIVTGKQELLVVDAVTTASLVNDAAAFEKAISKDGTWIISVLNDLTFDKALVVEGTFENGKTDAVTGAALIQRKIALYTQDEKRFTTGRFTLKAPKLTILSPKGSIEKGTFIGDLYISAPNFALKDAVVNGNVYFTTQEAKDTFVPDATSIITGVQELKLN